MPNAVPATGRADQRQEADKRLYVSPFYRVEGAYRFRLRPPGEPFDLVITKQVDGETDFTATLNAERRPLTDGRAGQAPVRHAADDARRGRGDPLAGAAALVQGRPFRRATARAEARG